MAKRKPILIGCPQYQILVRGTCECDEGGHYLRTGDGQLRLDRVRCGQYGGRCMQTLCVLHRYNRGGAGSWYPSGVWAMTDARRRAAQPAPAPDGGWYV